MQLTTLGCNLGDKCLSDAELAERTFNFVTLQTYPNLISDNMESVVSYETDVSYIKFLMPDTMQAANIFFMKSSVIL